MLRKLITVIIGLTLITAGSIWYVAMRNRPEAVMQRFTTDLAQTGNTEKTYSILSPELTKGRESYWRAYLDQFKGADTPPSLQSQEPIKDTFNTYTDQNDPRRFIYNFKLQSKTYQLTIIAVKHAKVWTVDELHGDYRP